MRLSRRLAIVAAGIAAASAFAWLSAPTVRDIVAPLESPEEAHELIVLIRDSPPIYYPDADGQLTGVDVDLARLYAAEKKLPLRFVPVDATSALINGIAADRAHIGAGGLYRPLPATTPNADGKDALSTSTAASAANEPSAVSWTAGYYTVELILIYNRDGYKPGHWSDLDGASIAYLADTEVNDDIAALRLAHPAIKFEPVSAPSPGALISQVSDGTIDYAIVGSAVAAIARNIYLDFEIAFPAGDKRDVAWIVPERFGGLREDLDRFFARIKRDGTLAQLVDRYLSNARQIQRLDSGALQERMETMLPQFGQAFRDAQERTGIEWRLLAAIAYQESQWDPGATSETGVRGLMQITEDTARHLGLADRLDPKQSALGAARYLRDLKDKLPARIQEPDRTWLALAAYNIGVGHLEDARVLAQKQKLNPDLWSDVKKALPLLALPEYYESAKLGYARGGMPVAFVDRVRGYYDVLLAHQPPHRPRLRMGM